MIFSKLSEIQKDIVRQDGNILLTACPGSGKTRVLIHKLAYELDKMPNESKKKIIALTYTVRASEEISRRLNALGVHSNKLWTGTLHSFCLEWILRPYSCYLKELKNGYYIADEAYCSGLIDGLKEKHNVKLIESVNQRIRRDGTFVTSKTNEQTLLTEYHKILHSRKMMDFELILFHSYRILKEFPKVRTTLANLIKLICVDEYQDTQDLQYGILSYIMEAGQEETNIILIGDTDQAIYTSLGGVSKNIEEVKSEFNNFNITELTLQGNYRSSQRIVDFYSKFQTKSIAITAIGKYANEHGFVTLNSTINKDDIAPEIARLITKSIESGIPEDEICVLVPQWWLITKISRKLRTLLPDVNFDASGLSPMSKNRDNVWYKLSKLLLTKPSPKIYSSRYRWAGEVLDAFRNCTNSKVIDVENPERYILRLVNSIKSNEGEGIDYLDDCFKKFIAKINIDYTQHLMLQESWILFFANIKKRLDDEEFKIPSDIESFKSFYREMTGVVINTCVGVKGEEFETVIAYGLLYGYIPHWNEIFNGNPEDASKKLMYVICSRAKKNLHLIAENGRMTASGKNEYVINPHLGAITFQFDSI